MTQRSIQELERILTEAQEELKAKQDPTDKVEIATCGTCGLSWNDAAVSAITPAPSARCPFEYYHKEAEELQRLRQGDAVRDYRYTVTVSAATKAEADQVMGERLGYDEDYGFGYEVDWEAV